MTDETMTTEILIDRIGAAHQSFTNERSSIIRAFLAGLSESEQLDLIEQEGENIQSQVAEALAHSPHFSVKQALMDTTADLTPDVAPVFAWATIAACAEYESIETDDETRASRDLRQQAADAIENNADGTGYLIAHMYLLVNG